MILLGSKKSPPTLFNKLCSFSKRLEDASSASPLHSSANAPTTLDPPLPTHTHKERLEDASSDWLLRPTPTEREGGRTRERARARERKRDRERARERDRASERELRAKSVHPQTPCTLTPNYITTNVTTCFTTYSTILQTFLPPKGPCWNAVHIKAVLRV